MPSLYEPYYTAAIPTFAALKSLYHRDGRVIAPKVQLYDADLNPVHLSDPPNPNDDTDIGPFVTSLSATNNSEQDVHRSLNLTINEELDKRLQYNSLMHRVKVWVEDFASSTDKDNGIAPLMSVPVGVYMGIFPDRDLASSGNTWTITLHGRTQAIADVDFINEFTVPANYSITTAMQNIVMADGLPPSRGGREPEVGSTTWPFGTHPGLAPNGCNSPGANWPESQIMFPPCDQVTPADRSWTNKENQLAGLKDLAGSVNWFMPFDDANGNLVTGPMPYYTQAVPEAVWDTLLTDDSSIMWAPIQQRLGGLDKIANCVVVESQNNNSDHDPIYVEVWNESASSLVSTKNLKRTITAPPIQDDNIPDEATAMLRGIVELQYAATAVEQITLNHLPNPHIFNGAPDKVLKLNVFTSGGQPEITSESYPFRIVTSTLTITKGRREQQTTLRRVVYI